MRVGYVSLGIVVLTAVAVSATAERTMRRVARAEAQAAAEAAALAGASAFLDSPGDAPLATARAVEYVARNSDHRFPTVVRPEDITLDPKRARVTLRVEARAYRFPAMVSLLTGRSDARESATATAEACTPADGSGSGNGDGARAAVDGRAEPCSQGEKGLRLVR